MFTLITHSAAPAIREAIKATTVIISFFILHSYHANMAPIGAMTLNMHHS